MTEKISKMVELVKLAKPKNVCLLLEAPSDFVFGDPEACTRTVETLHEVLDEIQSVESKAIPVRTHIVIRRQVPEGQAQILPIYGFFSKKVKTRDVMAYDVVVIRQLDNKYLVVKVPEGIDLLPYAKLD